MGRVAENGPTDNSGSRWSWSIHGSAGTTVLRQPRALMLSNPMTTQVAHLITAYFKTVVSTVSVGLTWSSQNMTDGCAADYYFVTAKTRYLFFAQEARITKLQTTKSSDFSGIRAQDGISKCSGWSRPWSCQCQSHLSAFYFGAFELRLKLISMTAVANLIPAHFKTAVSTVSVGLVGDYTVNAKWYVFGSNTTVVCIRGAGLM